MGVRRDRKVRLTPPSLFFREFVNQCRPRDTNEPQKGWEPSVDLILVRKVLAKEPEAVECFVHRMRCIPRLVHSRSQHLGLRLEPDEVDEASQQVFAVIWSKLGEYRGEAALETWVFPFCSLTVLSLARRSRRRPQQLDERQQARIPERDPGRSVDNCLDDACLHAALAQLPAEERIVVQLKQFEQLTFEQIGEQLSISANTAKSRYYRGLTSLRECLQRLKLGHEE